MGLERYVRLRIILWVVLKSFEEVAFHQMSRCTAVRKKVHLGITPLGLSRIVIVIIEEETSCVPVRVGSSAVFGARRQGSEFRSVNLYISESYFLLMHLSPFRTFRRIFFSWFPLF